MAVYRRHLHREARLKASAWVDAMLVLLIAIGVTGFLVEGARIAVNLPAFEKVSFVGYGLALLTSGRIQPRRLPLVHRSSWILHAALCIAFFAAANGVLLPPYRFVFDHRRPSSIPLFRNFAGLCAYPDRDSQLEPPADILWKDLLDGDACTTCGRCTAVCPATAAGKLSILAPSS